MRRATSLLYTLVALAATAVGAGANDRTEIEVLYSKLAAAIKSQQFERTLALEAPGFVWKTEDGKTLTGAEFVKQMKQESATVKSVKEMTIKVLHTGITGKIAKVTTSFTYTNVVTDASGQFGAPGKEHEISMSGTVTNELVKTSGAWKFKTFALSAGSMSIDGTSIMTSKQVKQPAGKPH